MKMKLVSNAPQSAAASPNEGRRVVLFGLPAAGLTLFAATRATGAEAASADPPPDPDQPQYRETELVRRYYQRARF